MSEAAQVTTPQTQTTAPEVGTAAEVKQTITKKASVTKQPEVKATTEPKKTYKIQSDKGEYEVDEDTYHAEAQKGFTASKRMREAAAREKAALEALKVAQEKEEKYNQWQKLTPDQKVEQALTDLKDPNLTKATREKIEKWLWQQLQADQATPEQKRLMELEAEKAQWEKEKADRQAQAQKEKHESEKRQYAETAQKDVIKIIEIAGVPVTEHNFKLAADYLYINHKAKSGATPEQIAEFVKNDTIQSTTHLFGSIADNIVKAREANDTEAILKAGQSLLDYLPPQVVKALRIVDYTRHIKGMPQAAQQQPIDVPKAPETEKKGAYEFKNMDEWIEHRRKMVHNIDKASSKRA